jgi:hypothetical protein
MGKDLVPVGQVYEAEANETPYEAHDEAIYDEYVDVLPAGDEQVSTPLDQADEDALALGIASVFDELRAEAEEPTLALLAELNRIWAQPLAA